MKLMSSCHVKLEQLARKLIDNNSRCYTKLKQFSQVIKLVHNCKDNYFLSQIKKMFLFQLRCLVSCLFHLLEEEESA